jgi:hypothetical protein
VHLAGLFARRGSSENPPDLPARPLVGASSLRRITMRYSSQALHHNRVANTFHTSCGDRGRQGVCCAAAQRRPHLPVAAEPLRRRGQPAARRWRPTARRGCGCGRGRLRGALWRRGPTVPCTRCGVRMSACCRCSASFTAPMPRAAEGFAVAPPSPRPWPDQGVVPWVYPAQQALAQH